MPKGEYLQYGGMAIMEGVMMRSPNHFAVACRIPDGSIIVHEEPIKKNFARTVLVKIPILRGVVALIDSMALGIRAMNFSADTQLRHEEAGKPEADRKPAKPTSQLVEKVAIAIAIITGLGMSFVLFQGTPVFIAQAFAPLGIKSYIALNIIEGILKAGIFLGYLKAISGLSAVRNLFQYHGAEHKAINCLEHDQELTIGNVRKQTRLHPRCGTSFLVIVMLLSMITFTFVPRDFNTGSTILNLLIRIGIKIPVLPILSGIAYEGIRFAGKMKNQRLLYTLFWPGLMTQYITTAEPDEPHIEVALASLKEAMGAEERDRELPEAAVATL
ncbi:MAG: DUF1385 domain-containing protein [Fimbriimonadales bacterium]